MPIALTTQPNAAGAIDALSIYDGRPNIPIGALKGPAFLSRPGYVDDMVANFPTRYKNVALVPDAIAVFRRAMVNEAADTNVVLVTIGPFRNIQHFLQSPPDSISPLTGKELINKKVKFMVSMGGVLVGGAYSSNTEWNIGQDIPAAQYVAANFPRPITFSLFEIGWPIHADGSITVEQPNSPATTAIKTQDSRPAWDQTAILYAAHGLRNYWNLKSNGTFSFTDDGSTNWDPTFNKHHSYLVQKMKPDSIGAFISKIEAESGKPINCPDIVNTIRFSKKKSNQSFLWMNSNVFLTSHKNENNIWINAMGRIIK